MGDSPELRRAETLLDDLRALLARRWMMCGALWKRDNTHLALRSSKQSVSDPGLRRFGNKQVVTQVFSLRRVIV